MRNFQIKLEKQSNGTWGSPLNLIEIKGAYYYFNIDLHELNNALIMLLDEKYNKKFKIDCSKDRMFIEFLNTDSYQKKNYVICYDRYFVDGNTVYEFNDLKEKELFLRQFKINKLKQNMHG